MTPLTRDAAEHLVWNTCEAVEELAARDWSLPDPSHDAHITRLALETADAPVSIQWTILASIKAAAEALRDIRIGMQSAGITPTTMAALARTVLAASAKVLYVLAPADAATRSQHAREITSMEANSLHRALSKSRNFTTLAGLVPPDDYLTSIDPKLATHTTKHNLGEATLLDHVATILDERLRAETATSHHGFTPHDIDGIEDHVREHALWIFNNYSGIAHGLAWPKQMPTHDDKLPGDWTADLWIPAALALLATQEAWTTWGHTH